MHLKRTITLLSLLGFAGCHRSTYVVPETPMPPNTILLSQMMRELSAQPGFTAAMLGQIDKGSKKGPALLTPRLVNELRKRILGSDWQGLDRFPGWSMREINPTVRSIGHFAGKDQKLEAASAVHPGTSPAADQSASQAREFLDLGPYSLDRAETVSLDRPSPLPPFTTDGIVSTLGAGVTRGDGPNDLAPEHAASQRLADVLNRLAANQLDNTQTFTATIARVPQVSHLRPGSATASPPADSLPATTPQALIEALTATGHTVTVNDARYFANFGHLHFRGQDVMMPFWLDSRLILPNAGGRHLLVPASHAEYEWHIRGPVLNADLAYYFGVDGKSQWRTMDTLDQPWVLKRNAHTYTGAQAVEVTRLTGLLTVAYMHLHAAHPKLPFGGYYALGVCQDGVSAIEQKMTGSVTLFPNTADDTFFTDPRDAEVNAMIKLIPKDRDGQAPGPERIFGSLPTQPDSNGRFDAITIPGLAADLDIAYAAWRAGNLRSQHSWRFYTALGAGVSLALATGILLVAANRRRSR